MVHRLSPGLFPTDDFRSPGLLPPMTAAATPFPQVICAFLHILYCSRFLAGTVLLNTGCCPLIDSLPLRTGATCETSHGGWCSTALGRVPLLFPFAFTRLSSPCPSSPLGFFRRPHVSAEPRSQAPVYPNCSLGLLSATRFLIRLGHAPVFFRVLARGRHTPIFGFFRYPRVGPAIRA